MGGDAGQGAGGGLGTMKDIIIRCICLFWVHWLLLFVFGTLTKTAFHNSIGSDFVDIISKPDWSYWRVKGCNNILHELVITLPVALVLLVGIDATFLAGIILHKH